jgi:hypothetical protein
LKVVEADHKIVGSDKFWVNVSEHIAQSVGLSKRQQSGESVDSIVARRITRESRAHSTVGWTNARDSSAESR